MWAAPGKRSKSSNVNWFGVEGVSWIRETHPWEDTASQCAEGIRMGIGRPLSV
jgi:hypothetical protein